MARRASRCTRPPRSLGVLPCNGCGQCFTGCVRGAIFSTLPMLEGMVRQGEVTYRDGLFVLSLKEDGNLAHVKVFDLRHGQSELVFGAVFIAAGPLNTTAILLRSAGYYDRPVTLKESQKFVIPDATFARRANRRSRSHRSRSPRPSSRPRFRNYRITGSTCR